MRRYFLNELENKILCYIVHFVLCSLTSVHSSARVAKPTRLGQMNDCASLRDDMRRILRVEQLCSQPHLSLTDSYG